MVQLTEAADSRAVMVPTTVDVVDLKSTEISKVTTSALTTQDLYDLGTKSLVSLTCPQRLH